MLMIGLGSTLIMRIVWLAKAQNITSIADFIAARYGKAQTVATSVFFFSSRRRHTRFDCDWSSDVCSSDLFQYGLGALNGSTTTSTPCIESSTSPSCDPRSKPRPYWNPEHPPPWIATRRTLTSPSSARSSLIFVAARSVTVSSGVVVAGRSVISIVRIVAAARRGERAPAETDFVTGVSGSVEPFWGHLVAVGWSC